MLIQMVLYPGMTLLDMVGPAQVWSFLPGAEIQYVARQAGVVPTDCGLPVHATHDFSTAEQRPDVLFIGGAGRPTFEALADESLLAFVKDRGELADWVTSVCTGSLILGAAGLLRGFKATSHWGVLDKIADHGAIRSDARVCIDRSRATGGGVTSGIDFALHMAGLWGGEAFGRVVELIMEYNPAPPFGTGHPSVADSGTLEQATTLLAGQFG